MNKPHQIDEDNIKRFSAYWGYTYPLNSGAFVGTFETVGSAIAELEKKNGGESWAKTWGHVFDREEKKIVWSSRYADLN